MSFLITYAYVYTHSYDDEFLVGRGAKKVKRWRCKKGKNKVEGKKGDV
jgi:hypothetical protein